MNYEERHHKYFPRPYCSCGESVVALDAAAVPDVFLSASVIRVLLLYVLLLQLLFLLCIDAVGDVAIIDVNDVDVSDIAWVMLL